MHIPRLGSSLNKGFGLESLLLALTHEGYIHLFHCVFYVVWISSIFLYIYRFLYI